MSNAAAGKDFDVLVLGAGAAGCVAASAIASKGHLVALVGAFGGATAQSSGAVDAAPSHEKTAEALSVLRSITSDAALVGRDDDRELLLATEVGTIKPAVLAQRTQAFDLSRLPMGESITVVGFSGLTSFDAHAVAKMLTWSIKQNLRRDVVVHGVVCEFRGERLWRSSLEMARYVDDNATRFSQAIDELVKHDDTQTNLLIPAVLGRTHYRNWKHPKVFELLAMPHSVPGLRLADALRNGIAKKGIEIIGGEAVSAERLNSRVTSVRVDSRELRSTCVILATGRFFSGGFSRQGVRRERIFDLPLWHDGKPIEDLPSRQLTAASMSGEQPLLRAAVRVDEKFRPYDRMMELYALNLFAAGSSIESSLSLGSAALSGYLSAFHTLAALNRE